MQYDRVMALASGRCVKIDNSLKASVESISFELENNKKYEDSISIYNERDLVIDGTAYSNNNRVIIKNPKVREKAVKLVFNINTIDLEANDIISGNIVLLSNIGIISVPYKYTIVASTTEAMIKKIKTISDYYDYLNKNFEEAKELFTNKIFLKTPLMQNEFAMSLYEGLCKGSSINIAMIEFFKAFDIDITKFFKNIDDEVAKKYIDDTLDNLDIKNIANAKNLEDLLTKNQEKYVYDTGKDEILEEASKVIEILYDKDLLNVIASLFVRSNYIDEIAFKVYLRVIEKGSNISGIYDKFLLSIPENCKLKLPIYIYRLYFEDKNYSFDDKLRLYDNIISTFEESDDVYKLYSNEILEYAISRIYQNRITESLIKIYNKVLSIQMINENSYNNVLYLLRSHKLIVNNGNIRKIIIKYTETEKETKYDVINNIAYVPIFFDSYLILYEDVYGNRYYSENVTIKVLFNRKDLENYIIEKFPQKDIIDMTKIIKINENGKIINEFEIEEIQELSKNIKINIVIKNKFEKMILNYYYNRAMSGNGVGDMAIYNLKRIIFEHLEKEEKKKYLKVFLEAYEYKYVFEKVSFYGLDMLESSDLNTLFSKCIDMNDDTNKMKLLNDLMVYTRVIEKNSKIVLYLSLNYESSIEDMVFIMDSLVELGLDANVYAKKLLMYALECNDNIYVDYIYDCCNFTLEDDKSIEIAYLNKKATDYMLDGIAVNDSYFEKLTKYLLDNYEIFDELPIIFLMAITKYISTINILTNNDLRRILVKAMERLLKQDYIFAYFKKLNKHMKMPYYIMNKEYIEFHADKDFLPKAILTISGEEEKKEVELSKVFMNIYVKKITVFKNEVINYEVINGNDPTAGVLMKGTLTYDESYEFDFPMHGRMRSTFDYVNDAIVCLDRDNIEGLKKVIMDMTEKQEISKGLFNI